VQWPCSMLSCVWMMSSGWFLRWPCPQLWPVSIGAKEPGLGSSSWGVTMFDLAAGATDGGYPVKFPNQSINKSIDFFLFDNIKSIGCWSMDKE
jgi:hypothetical protein